MEIRETDVLIIGSGIAGLLSAYLLSKEKNVVLVTKDRLENSNSILAQGGIAAAIDKNDNWKNHYKDTLTAGSYHNDEIVTEALLKEAPDIIQQLLDLGVPFDKNQDSSLMLGREGGHNTRRIVHAGGDSTGKEITKTLINLVKNKVTIAENEQVIDLLTSKNLCIGAIAKDKNEKFILYKAKNTVLATGGIGNLYPITSNDSSITGDGLAMAYRAGAELVDLEFIQFHPTMLTDGVNSYGLVSEAVRGEGANLINEQNEYIMKDIHPLKDLAPRDIVARTIFNQIQKGHKIFLDISMINNFDKRFPTITEMCTRNNIDIKPGRLPVAPGAHFIMGGIKTNIDGETSIRGLYAIGEAGHTGLHGANRLASNSLLEGVILANRLAKGIMKHTPSEATISFPLIKNISLNLPEIKEIQEVMANHVGIVRNKEGLLQAKQWFERFLPKSQPNSIFNLSTEQLIKINMLTVGWLITTSALLRTESRGSHFRSDYPKVDDQKWLKRSIVRREENESNQTKNPASTAIC